MVKRLDLVQQENSEKLPHGGLYMVEPSSSTGSHSLLGLDTVPEVGVLP